MRSCGNIRQSHRRRRGTAKTHILLFHRNSGYANAPHCYVICTLSALLNSTVRVILGFSRIERYTPVKKTCRLGCEARQQNVDHILGEPTVSTFTTAVLKLCLLKQRVFPQLLKFRKIRIQCNRKLRVSQKTK